MYSLDHLKSLVAHFLERDCQFRRYKNEAYSHILSTVIWARNPDEVISLILRASDEMSADVIETPWGSKIRIKGTL